MDKFMADQQILKAIIAARPKNIKGIPSCVLQDDIYFTNVYNNPSLLDEHAKYINKAYCTNAFNIKWPYKVTRDMGFALFRKFETMYPLIYQRWCFLIEACYMKDSRFYKYFGGKGIKVGDDFRDSRKFCLWCLKNHCTYGTMTYNVYLQRRDKTKDYTADNCFVIREKEMRSGTNMNDMLSNILNVRAYKEYHHKTVKFPIFYTRYYTYDMDIDSARSAPRDTIDIFNTSTFYNDNHSSDDVTLSVFERRYKSLIEDDCDFFNPYDLLRPDFSITNFMRLQGKYTLDYKDDIRNGRLDNLLSIIYKDQNISLGKNNKYKAGGKPKSKIKDHDKDA